MNTDLIKRMNSNEMRQVFAACEIGSRVHIVNSKGAGHR